MYQCRVYWRRNALGSSGVPFWRMPVRAGADAEERIAQAAMLAIMLGVTAFSEKAFMRSNYGRAHNYQQVPD